MKHNSLHEHIKELCNEVFALQRATTIALAVIDVMFHFHRSYSDTIAKLFAREPSTARATTTFFDLARLLLTHARAIERH